ncbi:MAG: alpha-mannosidase [Microthrixaceae bacterium]|nr:alpha-mannosidase [Microthrixaceae bacterium]
MHEDRAIAEGRLVRVRRELIAPNRWRQRTPLTIGMWAVPDDPDGGPGEPVPVSDALAAVFDAVERGTAWGRPWGTTWFKLTGRVPDEWAGEAVEAILDLGFGAVGAGFMAEGLVWSHGPDGVYLPERGLHPAAHTWELFAAAHGGETVELLVEAASNPLIDHLRPDPNSDRLSADASPRYFIGAVELGVADREVTDLHVDVGVLSALAKQLDADSTRAREIAAALDRCIDALDPLDVPGTAAAARAELAEVLGRPAVPSAHRITAAGHAHIDSAWLWPLRETKRKCARTFSNVLRLMEEDDELIFVCSQAAQYEWMRELYPSIFEQIRERVAEGRWVPVGGSWVEADGNITGGESHVRQLLHGQRFFNEHFGVTCSEAWIPDVFGYPGSLPQIYRLAGLSRFLTQKLSWNRTNRFPHHTFRWEGIDGSRVFTHFPPVDTYNASIEPFELVHAERNFAERGVATRSFMPFGFGDGGGGPNRDMLRRIARVRDLEGLPRIEMGSAAEFFDAAEEDYPDAPVWFGELYFEMHRGTYTSQARTKQGNRRCEALLREAELWSVAAFGGRAADGYPADELDRICKEVLLHQFHDILPGSSIGWVHREAEATYERLVAELGALIDRALRVLCPTASVLANAAPHDRDEVVLIDDGGVLEIGQRLGDGRVAVRAEVAACGFAPAAEEVAAPVTLDASSAGVVMDNGRLRVRIDESGCVVSLYEVASDRELIAAGGRGGLPQLHHDLPYEFDAWDIEEYYRRRVTDLVDVTRVEVLDEGPLVVRVAGRWEFGSSSLVQTFALRAGAGRLDVDVELDWRERDHLLKLAWPLDLLCSEVTRHIQYGAVRSAIHTNTSWDHARFEVCAHQWISAAEGDFGAALLSDSRYGYDATRTRGHDGRPSTTIRLTAVRGARYPDPHSDEGGHRFRYSVQPHGADLSPVVQTGYFLRHPVRLVTGGDRATPAPPVVSSSHPGVIVEVVKAAEDRSGDLIIRAYEALGSRATATLSFWRDVGAIGVVDLLEEHREDVPVVPLVVDGSSVTLRLAPFQMVTLRVGPPSAA